MGSSGRRRSAIRSDSVVLRLLAATNQLRNPTLIVFAGAEREFRCIWLPHALGKVATHSAVCSMRGRSALVRAGPSGPLPRPAREKQLRSISGASMSPVVVGFLGTMRQVLDKF